MSPIRKATYLNFNPIRNSPAELRKGVHDLAARA